MQIEQTRYHRKAGFNVLRIEPNGHARFLTLFERIRYWLGGRP